MKSIMKIEDISNLIIKELGELPEVKQVTVNYCHRFQEGSEWKVKVRLADTHTPFVDVARKLDEIWPKMEIYGHSMCDYPGFVSLHINPLKWAKCCYYSKMGHNPEKLDP